jgi:hypothetical protein
MLHNEELPDLYRSPSVVEIGKCRRLLLTGHEARMRDVRN